MIIPPIYFYLPESKCSIHELPKNVGEYWQWQIRKGTHEFGDCAWTLLTYLYLKESNFPCYFTNMIPLEGICISHRPLLSDTLKPNSQLLLVAIQGDRGRHPYAQLHVVQNPLQQVHKKFLNSWESSYIPFWTQPGLIPRNPQRGNFFKNIAFFGQKNNLILPLRQSSWKKTLKELDLNWQIIPPTSWNDYSEVDAIVAIRKFGYSWDHTWKPASKLHNSWLAGVPAIFGCESAYQAERQSELDYLEVSSFDSLLSTIKLLKENIPLREKIFKNSQVRAKEVQPENTISKWQNFLTTKAVPKYQDWVSMPESKRQEFIQLRALTYPFYLKQRQLRFINAKLTNIFTPENFVGQTGKYL
ncbi:hypothetical protein IQ215_02140 [Cyanobacterium stanieri LEGE 03274]|uniref:Glycosyltransferase n=1 Tax=Cyanobacterium stanieri LEGE 03274 TaxID=1828756 RepID=A0ABR9V0T4_9CHRO|nr:hypothetical protein [Cyanobacterium stanieri]MBE9221487.1 hypothetical protein [Cyanobacterium stanieri LEGE 03274]